MHVENSVLFLNKKLKLFTYGTINSETEFDANEKENYRMVATFRANNMNFIEIQTKAHIDRSSLFVQFYLTKRKVIGKSKRKVKICYHVHFSIDTSCYNTNSCQMPAWIFPLTG